LLVSGWLVLMAFLLISAVPTLSWGKLRPRRHVRLELIAFVGLLGAALLTEPWWTMVGICAIYLTLIPVGWFAYARVRRQRATRIAPEPASPEA
ncbi:MAG: CDP-diacylglycerol O-phosphatidyltransferase, partial [Sphingomonadales bacterium]|nr:CDP-diacylglycerol O-phosphatidyltransferase [Sphingomonadales bacterium]